MVTLGRNMLSNEPAALAKPAPFVFTRGVNVQMLNGDGGAIRVLSNTGTLLYSSTVMQENNIVIQWNLVAAGYIIKVTG